MKLDGIKGDVVAEGHAGEIEIDEFSLAVSNSGSSGGGGTATSKPNFQDLNVSGVLSKVSPELALACATSREIPTAKLTFQRRLPDGKWIDHYVVNLTKVKLTSVSTHGTKDDARPTESFSLNYATIEWVVTPIDTSGKLTTPVIRKFDLSTVTGQ